MPLFALDLVTNMVGLWGRNHSKISREQSGSRALKHDVLFISHFAAERGRFSSKSRMEVLLVSTSAGVNGYNSHFKLFPTPFCLERVPRKVSSGSGQSKTRAHSELLPIQSQLTH